MIRSVLGGLVRLTGDAASLAVGAGLGAQIGLRYGIARSPRPMPHRHSVWLEHPWRMIYRNPVRLLAQTGLFAGMSAADLGCGTGWLALAMAHRVGVNGIVYAVDIQAPMIAAVAERVASAPPVIRIQVEHAGLHELPLPDESLDVATLVAVLGEVPAPELALYEVQRVLKPGGRLLISEELPDPAYVPSTRVRRLAQAAGLRFGGQTGSPFCYAQIYYRE